MKKITVLVPAYNEALNLPNLATELNAITSDTVCVSGHQMDMTDYEWEYLFVNDGSKDNTLEVLHNLRNECDRINIVNLSRNFGKENAMLAGMDYASGDAVIIMDADLQHPVSAIPQMIYWWEQGYDDVYGLRNVRGKESWLRKRLSHTYYALLQGSTHIEILQNVGDFRLLDRRVINAICSLRKTQRYTKGLYCWVGYNKKEVLFDQGDRIEGKSSYNLKSLINLAIEGITCYTMSPLRIAAVLGFIVSIIAFVYLLFVLTKTLLYGEAVQGFPTLLCTILFIGGIQLIAMGIIGEYVGRIFTETKKRPVYIVESYNGKKI